MFFVFVVGVDGGVDCVCCYEWFCCYVRSVRLLFVLVVDVVRGGSVEVAVCCCCSCCCGCSLLLLIVFVVDVGGGGGVDVVVCDCCCLNCCCWLCSLLFLFACVVDAVGGGGVLMLLFVLGVAVGLSLFVSTVLLLVFVVVGFVVCVGCCWYLRLVLALLVLVVCWC